MEEFSYEDIEAATRSFAPEKLIGKGSHGIVYKATLKDGQIVAVKTKKPSNQSLENDAKLREEIDMLASIKKNSFTNIVNLVGVSRSPTNNLLIMEFMPNGSLHDLLHSSPNPPPWPRRAAVALQIALAVRSLHAASPAVIHRDIKSANILFDRKWNAKLADFSLAVRSSGGRARLEPEIPAGTIGYLDPSYTESGKLGPESDVFSYGVVLLELVTASKVVDLERDPPMLMDWALPAIMANRIGEVCDGRVAMPGYMRGAIGRMASVAARCVSEKMERRPSMGEVVVELQRVVEDLTMWPACGVFLSREEESGKNFIGRKKLGERKTREKPTYVFPSFFSFRIRQKND